ncbi:hypothetical protein CDD83_5596 [Cordyceps sp. RAO-2017]|nr:hypothetical protein CDD83_5596 [Cordyceps sp. RAO-2017]
MCIWVETVFSVCLHEDPVELSQLCNDVGCRTTERIVDVMPNWCPTCVEAMTDDIVFDDLRDEDMMWRFWITVEAQPRDEAVPKPASARMILDVDTDALCDAALMSRAKDDWGRRLEDKIRAMVRRPRLFRLRRRGHQWLVAAKDDDDSIEAVRYWAIAEAVGCDYFYC